MYSIDFLKAVSWSMHTKYFPCPVMLVVATIYWALAL